MTLHLWRVRNRNNSKIEKKIKRKRIKKSYYYFASIFTSFLFSILSFEYHSPISLNIKKFYNKKFYKNLSINENGKVLIYDHIYHEECFQILGLKYEYYYKYLDKSIDELTKLYN